MTRKAIHKINWKQPISRLLLVVSAMLLSWNWLKWWGFLYLIPALILPMIDWRNWLDASPAEENRHIERSILERIHFEQQMAIMTNWPVSLMVIRMMDWKWSVTKNGTSRGQWMDAICHRIETILPPYAWILPLNDHELVVWLANEKKERQISEIAGQIIRLLRVPMELGEHVQFWDGCIGISALNERNIDVTEWIKEARLAAQIALEHHEEIRIYSDALIESSKRLRLIEQELVGALKRNEFILYYQPKVNPLTDEMIGAESLLRWNHPRLGMVSPVEFIPLAERTGLIHSIGEWVLEEACKQLKHWHRRGFLPVTLSVNVSACQIQRPGFWEKALQIIEDHGIENKWIELEITETGEIHHMPIVLEAMNRLRIAGVKLSIDDFGTGYSSYEYLYQFPVHTLKLDLRFLMKGNHKVNEREIIVKSMIDLAKSLKLQVIAEGIESLEWYELLRRLGCDGIQGYFISRPEPAKKMEHMLNQDYRFHSVPLAAIG